MPPNRWCFPKCGKLNFRKLNLNKESIARLWKHLMIKKEESLILETKLDRSLGAKDLVLIAMGPIVGCAVYCLPSIITAEIGPAVIFHYLCSCLLAFVSVFIYSELTTKYTCRTGGYVFIYQTIGEYMAFFYGWTMLLQYLFLVAQMGRLFTDVVDYITEGLLRSNTRQYFSWKSPMFAKIPDYLSPFTIAVAGLIASLELKKMININRILMAVNIIAVFTFIMYGVHEGDPKNWQKGSEKLLKKGSTLPHELAIFSVVPSCFYTNTGIDLIALAVEETKNPEKNVKLSALIALLFLILIQPIVALCYTLNWSLFDYESTTNFGSGFWFMGIKWNIARSVVATGATVSIPICLLLYLYAASRIIYSLANDGLLYPFLSSVNPFTRSPIYATYAASLMAALVSVVLDVSQLRSVILLSASILQIILTYFLLSERYSGSTSINISQTKMQVSKNTYLKSQLTKYLFISLYLIFFILHICTLIFPEIRSAGIVGLVLAVSMFIGAIITEGIKHDASAIFYKVKFCSTFLLFSLVVAQNVTLKFNWITYFHFILLSLIGQLIYFYHSFKHSTSRRPRKKVNAEILEQLRDRGQKTERVDYGQHYYEHST